jgi:hypothetical protein
MSDATAYLGCAMWFWGSVLVIGGIAIGLLAVWIFA